MGWCTQCFTVQAMWIGHPATPHHTQEHKRRGHSAEQHERCNPQADTARFAQQHGERNERRQQRQRYEHIRALFEKHMDEQRAI